MARKVRLQGVDPPDEVPLAEAITLDVGIGDVDDTEGWQSRVQIVEGRLTVGQRQRKSIQKNPDPPNAEVAPGTKTAHRET